MWARSWAAAPQPWALVSAPPAAAPRCPEHGCASSALGIAGGISAAGWAQRRRGRAAALPAAVRPNCACRRSPTSGPWSRGPAGVGDHASFLADDSSSESCSGNGSSTLNPSTSSSTQGDSAFPEMNGNGAVAPMDFTASADDQPINLCDKLAPAHGTPSYQSDGCGADGLRSRVKYAVKPTAEVRPRRGARWGGRASPSELRRARHAGSDCAWGARGQAGTSEQWAEGGREGGMGVWESWGASPVPHLPRGSAVGWPHCQPAAPAGSGRVMAVSPRLRGGTSGDGPQAV